MRFSDSWARRAEFCFATVLTASADVDVQVSFDHGAAFERLGGIHGVDDLPVADFVAQTIAGCAVHAGEEDGDIKPTSEPRK